MIITNIQGENDAMNKKLLTAALSATLVLGFGAQNAYAANQTIPADVGNQTVNTTTGGVAGTDDADKELTKTDSTLDSKVTPADGGTKVFPAKNEKENNAEGNKETTPADGGNKVFPAKGNENKGEDNKEVTPADGGNKVFPAKGNENKGEDNKEVTPADGGSKVFPAKENNAKSDKNNKANDESKVFPAKDKKDEKDKDDKKDKEGGDNPKTGVATSAVAMTAALASAGFAVSKKRR